MSIKCPICNKSLVLQGRTYKCENNHCYDLAKEGYVNLLKKQGGKDYGDSPDMVKARRAFFDKDYYKPLKEFMCSQIGKVKHDVILDLGCGEGYYTNFYKDNLESDIIALDIAKEAVKIASKRNSKVKYIVASVQDIPVFDQSIDVAVNAFTPIDLDEITRVIKKDGYLITARVGEKHLYELKEALYDNIYLNDNSPLVDERLELIDSQIISFNIVLNSNEDIVNLFMMTPYYHHTSLSSKEKLKELDHLDVRCEFNVDIYKNTKGC